MMQITFSEHFDQFLEQHGIDRFQPRFEDLDNIVQNIGYTQNGSLSPIVRFLNDNPAAMGILVEFIAEQGAVSPKWKESLSESTADYLTEDVDGWDDDDSKSTG